MLEEKEIQRKSICRLHMNAKVNRLVTLSYSIVIPLIKHAVCSMIKLFNESLNT